MKKHLHFLILVVLALLFSFNACGGDDDVNVTGVTLNKTVASIYVGSSERLTATVQPGDAKNREVSWASSDTAVATVSEGAVTGVAPGAATVTVTTEQGDFKATCVVTVAIPPVTNVSLNKTATTILEGQDERLTATVTPATANQHVTWASSNPNVAAIARDGDGLVLAVAGPGTANITATSADGKITSAPCAVTVRPNNIVITGVTVSPASLTLMASIPAAPTGDTTAQLSAVVAPPNAPPTPIAWSVSDPAKASITSAGRVTALAGGNVDIIATAGGFSGICTLAINDPVRVTGITVTPGTATIQAGQTLQLTAAVAPANATYRNYSWSSSAAAVATVSSTGLVTSLRAGTVTITATALDGSHRSSCEITVTPSPVVGVSVSPAIAECLLNGTVRLTANLIPSYAENRNVTWGTSNASVATVTTAGVVTGHSLGEATITVTTQDGGFMADCAVTVVTELTIMNVYTAGYNLNMVSGLLATYRPIWGKNNQSWLLDPTAYDWGWGYGVSVDDNGDVYIAGWDDNTPGLIKRRQAQLWKNGVPAPLAKPFGEDTTSTARAIFISGADIYVGGIVVEFLAGGSGVIYHPYIWKNNAPQRLPTVYELEGCVTSLSAAGANVYAVGYDCSAPGADGRYVPHAAIWENGTHAFLQEGAGVSSWATSVSVSGGNVYVAGYIKDANGRTHATLWKDGEAQTLTPCAGTDEAYASSVFADGGKVYVAGYSLYRDDLKEWLYTATLWEDGSPTPLGPVADTDIDSQALSVHVYRSNVFVSGVMVNYQNNVWDMLYWRKVGNAFERNVISAPAGAPGIESYPYSIFVSGL